MTDKMREFDVWYEHDDQAELRASCAKGWAEVIWSASRAAVVVELPPKWNSATSSTQQAWDMGIEDCKIALEAAGVKVKS
ncbi:hypothetical protein [Pseudomonas sp. O11]|uniref:hypothetical protein n=1 Tax=Pseudomonas sp. O11 TaxID=3159446 RepID=UPI00387AC74B